MVFKLEDLAMNTPRKTPGRRDFALIGYFLALALTVAIGGVASAYAGEHQTTWRAGEMARIGTLCRAPESWKQKR